MLCNCRNRSLYADAQSARMPSATWIGWPVRNSIKGSQARSRWFYYWIKSGSNVSATDKFREHKQTYAHRVWQRAEVYEGSMQMVESNRRIAAKVLT